MKSPQGIFNFKISVRCSVSLAATLIFGILGSPSAHAQSMTSQDHILYLPGHTQTTEWSEEKGGFIFTCDYKSLQGVTPKKGEPCGTEPRLSLSVDELKKLKYAFYDETTRKFIYDNSRIIERIYEKFPDILFVIAKNTVQEFWAPEPEERGQFVDVTHPVDPKDYNFYAERADRFIELAEMDWDLKLGEVKETVLGTYVRPYKSSPFFGFDPVELDSLRETRPLAEYGLIVLPTNTSRTTLVHELLHHMIYRARKDAIRDQARLKQMGIDDGVRNFIYDWMIRKDKRLFPESSVPETEEALANYIIRYGGGVTEILDGPASEEVEISYFISKYGKDLGILASGVEDHLTTFWNQVKRYEETRDYVVAIGDGALREPAYSFIRKSPDLVIGDKVFKNHYPFIWDMAKQLARAYSGDLLTEPLEDGASNYFDRFSKEFFPRPPGGY